MNTKAKKTAQVAAQNSGKVRKARIAVPAGEHVDRATGEVRALDARTIRVICQGWNLKQQIERLQSQLNEVNAQLMTQFDQNANLVLPGLCRASIAEREAVKITDANKLRGVLYERFSDLVRETVQYKPEPKLVEMAVDADEPLAPAIRACLAVSKAASVTWRAEK